MSRLNPNANAFPAFPRGGRPSATTKACATSPPKTANPARALKEIDLTRAVNTPSNTTNHAWSRRQHSPSPTAPHYGHNWTTTFPPPKHLASSARLNLPAPKPSPVSVHRKSPSLGCLSPAGSSSNVNFGLQPIPTHPMTRQPSSSRTADTPYATRSSWTARSAYTHHAPYNSSSTFEPFADEDALLQEAINSRFTTYAGSIASHSCSESPRTLFNDNESSVFDDDGELGMSRNVYIPNPPSGMTKEVLQKYGQNFGRVVSVKVENSGEVSHEIIGQFPLKGGYDGRRYRGLQKVFVPHALHVARTASRP